MKASWECKERAGNECRKLRLVCLGCNVRVRKWVRQVRVCMRGPMVTLVPSRAQVMKVHRSLWVADQTVEKVRPIRFCYCKCGHSGDHPYLVACRHQWVDLHFRCQWTMARPHLWFKRGSWLHPRPSRYACTGLLGPSVHSRRFSHSFFQSAPPIAAPQCRIPTFINLLTI